MASGKDALDLYDGEDDLLDYGDDLEADLLDGADLAGVDAYDDLDDLGLDMPALDASSSKKQPAAGQNGTSSSTTAATASAKEPTATSTTSDSADIDDLAYDEADFADIDATTLTPVNKSNISNSKDDSKRDESAVAAETSQKRHSVDNQSNIELGGANLQSTGSHEDRSSYSSNSASTRGGGRGGGLRGRGNMGYGGRGNYQGGTGTGRGGHMMGMGMTQQQQMYAMQQQLAMSMGMNNGRFPSDGFGNQGMGYPPYNGGANMGAMGVTPGRNIHINPKFQNRAGVPTIPGTPPGLDRALGQQQQQQSPRQPYQESDIGQSPSRGAGGNLSARAGSQDRSDNDRFNRNQQYNNGRGDSRDGRDQGNETERGRGTDNSYRSTGNSEREFNQGQGPSKGRDFGGRSNDNGSGNWSGDSPRNARSQPHSPLPSYNNRASPVIGAGSPGSISSRLTPGLKRPGGAVDNSQKAHKSSGSSTPRSEQSRSSNDVNQGYGSDTGSVSFLRDRRDGGAGAGDASPQHKQHEPSSSNAVPTGFVKIDNIPDSLSDASIRQLAKGINGVDRVLTVSKKGGRSVVLGFGSVDEAKFFRRQINRTTVEGSLVTVTLTSA
ncbi:hypothetical protein EC991_005865 [Linnemannia zychae]|nr:hypothetical protein EC991_005865 [Linnemannia zychae]